MQYNSGYMARIVLQALPQNRVSNVHWFLKLTADNRHDVITVRSSAAAAPKASGRRTAFENTRLTVLTSCSFQTFASA